jgi:hypothetical protein
VAVEYRREVGRRRRRGRDRVTVEGTMVH